jgi:hypothetical protein
MMAFPSHKTLYWLFRQGDKPVPNEVIEQGMELRDYFAAKAMQAMIGQCEGDNFDDFVVAGAAYQMADFMMKARNDQK